MKDKLWLNETSLGWADKGKGKDGVETIWDVNARDVRNMTEHRSAWVGSLGLHCAWERGQWWRYFFDVITHLNNDSSLCIIPMPSPSRGGDVTVYVWHKTTKLAHSFLFCSCVYLCLYGPFNCIPFYKFSQQLSAFSLCSFGLISALFVLLTIYYLYESLHQPWHNPLWA